MDVERLIHVRHPRLRLAEKFEVDTPVAGDRELTDLGANPIQGRPQSPSTEDRRVDIKHDIQDRQRLRHERGAAHVARHRLHLQAVHLVTGTPAHMSYKCFP
jgi:hypothetical protein